MIQNIVFDMGNVLIRYKVKEYVHQHVAPGPDAEILLHEVFGSVEWLQLDRGTLDPEQAITQIRKRLPTRLHPVAQQFVLNWHSNVPLYPEMEELIRQLKQKGYGIYLLSNTSKMFHTFSKQITALQYFDGQFISADCGLLKPDPAIYRAFCRQFGLDITTCFFIDDVTANIESAIHEGMQGFVFRGNMPALKTALQNSGVSLLN
ncbi:HAD family phosphatase [Ruminococcaceae bacterium OttesenSCG-928-A16]|nr:HAD family phosphatase [Ruminococcaceae bacterium OttesenSCG-928-A16]